MSPLAGSVVSASWPLFLVAIPFAVGALVYLYRAKGIAHPRVASTLFLLSKIPQYAPSRRRFVPPLSFWIEALIALALASAASGIVSTETGDRIALVVDTSKSMGALLSADETRLQAALRIASADIAQAPQGSWFSVFQAGRTLTPVTAQGESGARIRGSAARAALQTLEPTYDTDTLAPAVAGILASGEYDSVWLYTDRSVESEQRSERLRVTTIPFDPDAARNVWIASLGVRDAEQPHGSKIEVGVSRTGDIAGESVVGALCTDSESGATFTLPSGPSRLAPDGTTLQQLGPFEKPWSYCRVSIGGAEDDLLSRDNEAWVVRGAITGELGLVSALSPKELGLEALRYGSVVPVSDGETDQRDFRGIIYHRTTPKKLPRSAALVVYPASGAKVWGSVVGGDASRGTSGAVEITRWDESHPLLQYVRPGLVSLPTARVLECPGSAQPVLFSASGPIACAGEEDGQRYVILGFEIFPFDGLRTPTLSIFTLNTFQWLLNATRVGATDIVSTGVVRLPASDQDVTHEVRMVAPRDQQLAAGRLKSVEVREPGVIVVREMRQGAQREQLLAINSISDQESDLALEVPIQIAPGGVGTKRFAQESTLVKGARDVTRYEFFFAWLAVVMLALDLCRRIIARSGWQEGV